MKQLSIQESGIYAQENFAQAIIMESRIQLWDYVSDQVTANYNIENPAGIVGAGGVMHEFGVYKGESINYFAKKASYLDVYVFDSFEGLPEAWSGSGQSKGAFSLGGKLPKVAPNVVLHKGWFSETAVDFFNHQEENLAFAHLDADLYNATLEALNAMAAKVKKGSLLLFDEYFGQIAWREHEHKAFGEWLENNKLEAECLAWVSNGAVLFRLK